jgi:hypothetical protein
MSKLLEQINQDLKAAMKSKDAFGLSVLRMLIAAARNKEITLRPAFAKASAGGQGDKVELTDEQIVEVVASEIKKRRDSVEAYIKGGRQELADKESAEIKVLEKYLPARMPDEELEKIVKEIIASGADNFGKIMGQAMAKVKGKADGGKVGELVKKLLAK